MSHSFFDRAIRRTLRKPAQPHSDPCPEANQLAEYIESRCSRAQRSKLEDHLAQCDPCQEVLALALKMDESEGERESPTLAGAGERRILFRFSIPISALVAVVTIVGTILLVRPVWKSQVKEVAQTAQVSAPHRSESDLLVPAPQAEKADKPAAQEPRKEVSRAASVPAALPAESKEKKARERNEDEKLAAVNAPPAQVPGEPVVAAGAPETPAPAREQNLAGQNMTILQQAGNRQFGAAPATGGIVGGVSSEIRATQDSAAPKTEELVASFFKLDPGIREQLPRRTVSDRSFYQWKGYWIDEKCLENPGAPVSEISGNDAEFGELAQQLQDLKGSPVVVFRLNRILILRAK